MSVLEKLDERLSDDGRIKTPKVDSFKDFLLNHAKVKVSGGRYIDYHLDGREALEEIIDTFDLVLGSHTGVPLTDSVLDVCGGAQIGKTILALNFGAYLTSCQFLNWGYYLPDDDLVEGIVDSKLRPDVVDQVEWLPSLMAIGKSEDKKGRKVDRKGAFMVSDGERKAFAMIRGMGKIPTTFSMDVAMEDEKDDIKADKSKFITGRMTGSDYRIRSSIGTQRLHGVGQNKQFNDGSQGVRKFAVTGTDRKISIEENWPEVCRMQTADKPHASDPQLTENGNFRDSDGVEFCYEPGQTFYFADPETGAVIDRRLGEWEHQRPEMIKQRQWSWRVAQVIFSAMPVDQAVSRWQAAVKDPDSMTVFKCDVLAMPSNTDQAITPEIIQRAQSVEDPYDLSLSLREGCKGFAGLDTGNQCWFYAREVESGSAKRARWAEKIPLGDVVRRAEALFHQLQLGALFIDARPAVNEARSLAYKLNQLEGITWPVINDPDNAVIHFPSGLIWDGKNKKWKNLKCAVVEFTKKSGGGIEHKIGIDELPGVTRFFPIIQCNRFDSIDRVVNEFMTPAENVSHMVDGKVLDNPIMRLPRKTAGCPPAVELIENHHIRGSQREKKNDEVGDYVDKCENHLLLANAYSAIAEMIADGVRSKPFKYEPVQRHLTAVQKGGLI